jgi:hypothetical protein
MAVGIPLTVRTDAGSATHFDVLSLCDPHDSV